MPPNIKPAPEFKGPGPAYLKPWSELSKETMNYSGMALLDRFENKLRSLGKTRIPAVLSRKEEDTIEVLTGCGQIRRRKHKDGSVYIASNYNWRWLFLGFISFPK